MDNFFLQVCFFQMSALQTALGTSFKSSVLYHTTGLTLSASHSLHWTTSITHSWSHSKYNSASHSQYFILSTTLQGSSNSEDHILSITHSRYHTLGNTHSAPDTDHYTLRIIHLASNTKKHTLSITLCKHHTLSVWDSATPPQHHTLLASYIQHQGCGKKYKYSITSWYFDLINISNLNIH